MKASIWLCWWIGIHVHSWKLLCSLKLTVVCPAALVHCRIIINREIESLRFLLINNPENLSLKYYSKHSRWFTGNQSAVNLFFHWITDLVLSVFDSCKDETATHLNVFQYLKIRFLTAENYNNGKKGFIKQTKVINLTFKRSNCRCNLIHDYLHVHTSFITEYKGY